MPSNQRLLPIKWREDGTTWKFLQRLMRYAPTQRPVTRCEINEENKDLNYSSKLVSKMSCLKCFPPHIKD
jgi:hypothetical protein